LVLGQAYGQKIRLQQENADIMEGSGKFALQKTINYHS